MAAKNAAAVTTEATNHGSGSTCTREPASAPRSRRGEKFGLAQRR